MHLVIVTSGSRGDVQPYLALALRAMQAGHRVTLATHEVFRPWITGHGVAVRCTVIRRECSAHRGQTHGCRMALAAEC
jgi:UDP:flavonoid glycosyltransferase YjiC (YdhE family)